MSADEPVSLILTGPTGIGKTGVAVELALRHGYELISADSMQVYRGMEIGTAQPTTEELKGIRIHGCGMIAPDEPFSAQRFVEFCESAHRNVLAANRKPLYVGGTGLYLRALRWGLLKDGDEVADKESAGESSLRQELNSAFEVAGGEVMYERLRQIDPDYAAKIGVRDRVRIVRALEVFHLTGKTMSSLQEQWREPVARFPHRLVVLDCPRDVLVRRIESRVDEMLEHGWIDEVRVLLNSGYSPSLHPFKALGYQEIVKHLEGKLGLSELRVRIKAVTRQFSKRQMTWFRKEREASWINYNGVTKDDAVTKVEKILEL